jgi:uncharacterized protein DUF3617
VKTTVWIGIVLLFSSAAMAAEEVPLNVKPGLWETTLNTDRTGSMPIPPEALARLSPEQRARLEEKMKANQGPKTTTQKTCVTKEDLNKPFSFGSDEKACHRTVISASGSKQEFRVECTAGAMKGNGTFQVEALNSESAKGTIQMTIGESGKTMNVKSTFTSKWIGPACPDQKK